MTIHTPIEITLHIDSNRNVKKIQVKGVIKSLDVPSFASGEPDEILLSSSQLKQKPDA